MRAAPALVQSDREVHKSLNHLLHAPCQSPSALDPQSDGQQTGLFLGGSVHRVGRNSRESQFGRRTGVAKCVAARGRPRRRLPSEFLSCCQNNAWVRSGLARMSPPLPPWGLVSWLGFRLETPKGLRRPVSLQVMNRRIKRLGGCGGLLVVAAATTLGTAAGPDEPRARPAQVTIGDRHVPVYPRTLPPTLALNSPCRVGSGAHRPFHGGGPTEPAASPVTRGTISNESTTLPSSVV